MDLTVTATPGYFATMAAERWWLRRRAEQNGPSPADYEKRDTAASLAMGTASLLTPFVFPKLLGKLVRDPRRRVRRGLLVATAGAVAVTTTADWLVRRESNSRKAEPDRSSQNTQGNRKARRKLSRAAEMVSSAGGVAALALGGVTITTLWAGWTSDKRLWTRRLLRDLGSGPLVVAGAVLAWDFIYYWNHRFMHESRFMWAIHVVHHSSERYNLSTALRQPVAYELGTFIPSTALALFGIRPAIIQTARGVNLLYQYWIHTDTVGRLGPVERVLNTPSHHRVHHGSNPRYIDRNHGSILIIWDRLFGTFEPEGERVVYGLTKNINTFNPLRIASHEYADIVQDVASSRTWRERLSYVLRGPGWAYQRHAERGLQGRAEEAPHSSSPVLAAAS